MALLLALGLVGVATFYRWYDNRESNLSYNKKGIPVPGEVGSEHSHASMLIFIDGVLFDFTKEKYQLKDAPAPWSKQWQQNSWIQMYQRGGFDLNSV